MHYVAWVNRTSTGTTVHFVGDIRYPVAFAFVRWHLKEARKIMYPYLFRESEYSTLVSLSTGERESTLSPLSLSREREREYVDSYVESSASYSR